MSERIVLMTCFDDQYRRLAEVAVPVMEAYCRKHGYDFDIFGYHTNPKRLESYGDRGKIERYKQMYDHYDIIMFLDIDALIMNSAIEIPDLLDSDRFLWTYDRHGPLSGMWIARTVPEVRAFLEEAQEVAARSSSLIVTEQAPPHTVRLQVEPHGISDQSAMRQIMHLPPYLYVAQNCISAKAAGHCFEANGDRYDYLTAWEPGDWIITFPGGSPEWKLAKMREYAGRAT